MSQPDYLLDCRVIREVMVPMRDGVKLATSVFLPVAPGRYSTVLTRNPYNRQFQASQHWAKHGLAYVTQDCRGRHASYGEFYPFAADANDGEDTLNWIAAQPWSNGKVGMYGDSYLAIVQLCLAPLNHPNLVSLNPRFMAGDPWLQAYYSGGVLSLALTFAWLCLEVGSRTSQANYMPLVHVEKFFRQLPLIELDDRFGSSVQYYKDFLEHHTRDEYWENLNCRPGLARTTAPTLLTCGWYDYYPGETFKNYAALLTGSASQAIRDSHRVIIGPWTHGIHGSSTLGAVDFGAAAMAENDCSDRWLVATLKGGSPAAFQKAPIRLFVMGSNQWRDEYEWPLARTRYTPFYLGSGGAANTLRGDGELNALKGASRSPSDAYTYDPENPTPTLGGNHSVGPYNPGLYDICLPGPQDNRPIEQRDDVLVYSSAVLDEDLEVTGPVMVKLYASSSAPDTDWVVRLTDVHPDGRSINLTEGILRARYREKDWANPRLIEPGKVYEYDIELQPTSNVFKRGHRIRLQVTSSNFPLWARNLNTGEHPHKGTRMQPAQQRILHDQDHPSHILLPVIPTR